MRCLPPISADPDALVREADIVALLLLPQTKNIINAERIAAMGNIQFSVANGRNANQRRANALIWRTELIAADGDSEMKRLSVFCVALCVLLPGATFARGGGSHQSAAGGGAFGTRVGTPGTNSLGTALSSSGVGRRMKGPLLGTNPAIDREEAKVNKMIASVCWGC